MIWSVLASLLGQNDKDTKKKDIYGQSIDDLNNREQIVQKRAQRTVAANAVGKETAPKGGLTGGDMLGMGLSFLGANEQQNAADSEAEELKKQQQQDQIRQGITDRQNAQQQYQNNFNTERGLNFSGLDALANMRDESRKIKTNSRFRSDMLRAIKGGA